MANRVRSGNRRCWVQLLLLLKVVVSASVVVIMVFPHVNVQNNPQGQSVAESRNKYEKGQTEIYGRNRRNNSKGINPIECGRMGGDRYENGVWSNATIGTVGVFFFRARRGVS